MAHPSVRLGCPLWGFKGWVGDLYSVDARPRDFLRQYVQVFSSVEGNTTFYSIPAPTTVARWRDQTPDNFRFCFKLPQTITHQKGLRNVARESHRFFEALAPLGQRLGPFMIQLPSSFGPDRLEVLDEFLGGLPSEHAYAVELRHPALFSEDGHGRWVDDILEQHGCSRVILDTRALRSGDHRHPDVLGARHAKPNLPIPPRVTGMYPLVRFVAHPDRGVNRPWLERWSRTLVNWAHQGLRPFVFIHCPNDIHAPHVARELHGLLAEQSELDSMQTWPGESQTGYQRRLPMG